MKTHRLLLILLFCSLIPLATYAQEKPKLQYTVGFGSSIDMNSMLYGLNFSNELNVGIGKRTSFNAGLSFYQSLGNLEKKTLPAGSDGKNKEQSSGLFFTPTLKYDFMQRPSGFNLAFAAGPSLQLGGESVIHSYYSGTPTNYAINKYKRIGLFMELEAQWNSKNQNRKNAASLSAFTADNGLWYINATYKVRFNLGKK